MFIFCFMIVMMFFIGCLIGFLRCRNGGKICGDSSILVRVWVVWFIGNYDIV